MTLDFRHVIRAAYVEILKREPDPGGLDGWNDAMNHGTTEWQLREAFLRSAEYAERFPSEVAVEPPPPPPPPPPGGSTPALHVAGNVFHNEQGQIVKLLGAISCCADADADCPGTLEYGWPLVTREWLNLLWLYHLNFAHIRLGPMVQKAWDGNPDTDGEQNPGFQGYLLRDNKYDLTRFEERYWANVRAMIGYAHSLGIYVQVDLADAWVLDHQLGPWSAHRNHQAWEGGSLAVMRAAPRNFHETWIRKAVRETGIFPNVIYQDGNESFKGGSQMVAPWVVGWVVGMQSIVKDELQLMGIDHRTRPFGTNCQREDIEEFCDYGVYHEKTAPDPTRWPRMTNEYAHLEPAAILAQVRIAWASGGAVSFHVWRGGNSGRAFLDLLASVRKVVDGTDQPVPVPDHCPPLVRWGSKVHNVMNVAFQGIDFAGRLGNNGQLPPGGVIVVVDSTPRFGTGNGEPCNDEHPGCGGRKCEDPRGGVWTLEEHPASYTGGIKIQANGFQARVGHPKTKQDPNAQVMTPGHYRLRVSPRPDCQDAEGKPVIVVGDASTTTEWDVV